jgi:chemotaxis receptor (MCP) glutamine deamidase CheD
MQDTRRSNTQATPRSRPPCQILAKKGFLTARNITSGVAILVYSREFQLGVLFHLPLNDADADTASSREDQAFARSAMSMILSEFQTLGVRSRDLLTYAIGGSAVDGKNEASAVDVRRALWSHGLSLSAADLGGKQVRSIWMDVESGRTIIRSQPIPNDEDQSGMAIPVAS